MVLLAQIRRNDEQVMHCCSDDLDSGPQTFLTTLAGFPTATDRSSISLVTTLPAPMVHPFPILTPGQMTTPPPIQQSVPMVIGSAQSGPFVPSLSSGIRGWAGV